MTGAIDRLTTRADDALRRSLGTAVVNRADIRVRRPANGARRGGSEDAPLCGVHLRDRPVRIGKAADSSAGAIAAHAAALLSRGARVAAANANSSKVAAPSDANAAQCSAGMLSRCIHDLTVWMETLRARATSSAVPAAFTMSACVCIPK